ncbi:unnamed protein product [Cuscuta epithymum]|uniref:Uncharacterized protein n=1 Tax=Cuscuta epithymum TaxID=186058 RepID=A0AAV0F383_9ASTE|nr:unnamed protein product [Cuscuta epithymum]
MASKEKFCPLLYENEGLAMTRPFGPWLRASGRKSKPNMSSKWLISEESSSGGGTYTSSIVRSMQEVDPGEIEGNQGSTKAGMGNAMISGEIEEEGAPGELKRRRTWEDQAREDAAKDVMALDSPKNRVGAGAGQMI